MASTSPLLVDHHQSVFPAPARPVMSRYHRPRIQWTTIVLVVVCFFCCSFVQAADAPLPTETLTVDARSPYLENGNWIMLSNEEQEARELRKRQSDSASTITTTFAIAVTTTGSQSTPTSATQTSTTAPSSPLPSPLDSMSSNFTGSSCPTFINSFLTNPTFKQCYPFSMLLQGSRSFFEAERSLVSITQVLDASCAANVTSCTTYMNDLATNLTDSSNCGDDYNAGNSVVVQAYIAMLAYQSLYSASCLEDPDSSMYCFASAITNLTTPSNVYVYYLPLNISLPGSSIPSCSWCLQQTMEIFQASAANRKLPIVNTYPAAAQQVDTICGPDFANETLPAATVQSSAFSAVARGPSWLLLALSLAAGIHWLL